MLLFREQMKKNTPRTSAPDISINIETSDVTMKEKKTRDSRAPNIIVGIIYLLVE